MTSRSTILLAAAVLAAISTPAVANTLTDNLYAGGSIGVTITRDSDVSESTVPLTATADFENALNVSAVIGTRLRPSLRGEIEIGYRSADLDLTIAGLPGAVLTGDNATWTALLNGYYDFMPEKMVSPYLGAGIGFARHQAELDIGGGTTIDDSDTVFAWQIGAGALFHASEHIDVQAGYRYLGTADAKFDTTTVKFGAHEVRLGLLYAF